MTREEYEQLWFIVSMLPGVHMDLRDMHLGRTDTNQRENSGWWFLARYKNDAQCIRADAWYDRRRNEWIEYQEEPFDAAHKEIMRWYKHIREEYIGNAPNT